MPSNHTFNPILLIYQLPSLHLQLNLAAECMSEVRDDMQEGWVQRDWTYTPFPLQVSGSNRGIHAGHISDDESLASAIYKTASFTSEY